MPSDFGGLLRVHRRERRLSQTQVVRKLQEQGYEEKYSKSTVSKWENGLTKPTPDVVEALEDIVGAPGGVLLSAAGYALDAEIRGRSRSGNEALEDPRDPLLQRARERHHDELNAVIADWKDRWFDPNGATLFRTHFDTSHGRVGRHGSGCLSWVVKDEGSPEVTFDIEGVILFDALREHLPEQLWRNFDQVKRWLSDSILQAASLEGDSDYSLMMKTERLITKIERQLDEALLKRVFPGKCRCCPG